MRGWRNRRFDDARFFFLVVLVVPFSVVIGFEALCLFDILVACVGFVGSI